LKFFRESVVGGNR